jgi:hypothetical protein
MTLEELLQNGPDYSYDWVQKSLGANASKLFNWLGLAEVAAHMATNTTKQFTAHIKLTWAAIATQIYNHLAHANLGNRQNDYELSSMNVRAALIGQLGHDKKHPLLDVAAITDWFNNSLPWHYEEIVQMANQWREKPIGDIRTLRRIKNRIAVLKVLANAGHLGEESQKWVNLHGLLP